MKRTASTSAGSSSNAAPKASPSKKSRKNVSEDQQPELTSFFASPTQKSKGKQVDRATASQRPQQQAHEIISLLSSEEEEEEEASPKKQGQSATAAKVAAERKQKPARRDGPRQDLKPFPVSPARLLGANDASHSSNNTPLDQLDYPIERDLFDFDPTVHIDTHSWPTSPAGGSTDEVVVPYAFLARAFQKISATKSRLEITKLLANTLRTVICYQPAALLSTVYLITNHVAPAYEGVELGVGSQVLGASLKSVSGVSAAKLKTLWNKHGDPGDVAFEAKSSVRTLVPTAPLTIVGVHATFLQIASLKGQGVTSKKSGLVNKMLVAARGEETRFIVRSLCANLRIGAVRLTVTSALARAFCLHQGQMVSTNPVWRSSPLAIPLSECQGLRALAKTAKEGKDDPRRKALMARMAQAEGIVRKVYVRHPNYDHILAALLRDEVGLEGLEAAVPLQVGTPLNNMLGQITRSLDDVAQRFSEQTEFAAEFKYDGQRIQVHACRGTADEKHQEGPGQVQGKKGLWVGPNKDLYVRLFSRHLEDMTDKYPDVLQLVYQMFERSKTNGQPLESIIVDAEIVAIDGPTGNLLDFQTLATRARKDVAIGDVRVKAKIFAFDLMYLNGEPLLAKTFRERRNLLQTALPPYEDFNDPTLARFGHVESLIGSVGDLAPVEAFFHRALSSKCEGIMVKILDHEVLTQSSQVAAEVKEEEAEGPVDANQLSMDVYAKPEVKAEEASASLLLSQSPSKSNKSGRRKGKMLLPASYEPDKRADAWLKVKKDYAETGGDSLDLVPIAVWHGQGRKAGWWSPILLAVYDPATDQFSAVCKCISGFSDQFYKDLMERYPPGSDVCFKKKPSNVDSGIAPDWFLKPSEVWEIRGADISLSPVYPAAKGLLPGERGLSLRFPRFMKLREDKSVEQATTPQEFVGAYQRQQAAGVNSGADGVGAPSIKPSPSRRKGLGSESDGEIEEYPSEEEVFDEL